MTLDEKKELVEEAEKMLLLSHSVISSMAKKCRENQARLRRCARCLYVCSLPECYGAMQNGDKAARQLYDSLSKHLRKVS